MSYRRRPEEKESDELLCSVFRYGPRTSCQRKGWKKKIIVRSKYDSRSALNECDVNRIRFDGVDNRRSVLLSRQKLNCKLRTARKSGGRFRFLRTQRRKGETRRKNARERRWEETGIIRNGGELTSFRKFQLLGRIRSVMRFTFFSIRADWQIPLRSFIGSFRRRFHRETRVASEKLKRWRR